MSDENKKTIDQVKEILTGIVKEHMESGEYATLTKLQDEIKSELADYVKTEDIAEFKEALEKLRELPGPGGAADIKMGDNDLKGLNPRGGYEMMAEFAKDVVSAGKQGVEPSAKFSKWHTDVAAYNKAMKAAGSPSLEIGDPEQGGYLAPPEFSRTLLERGFENSNFLSRCRKIPMAINQIGIPYVQDFDHSGGYRFGALQGKWLDEKAAKTGSKPKFGKVTLRLNKFAILVYSSDELLEDSMVSMEPMLQEMAGDEIAWNVDDAILNGTGAGMPLGCNVAGNPSLVTVTKETGQAAATIVFENVIKMYAQLWPRGHGNAMFIANNQAFPQLALMSLPVGTGGAPVYLPANGAAGRPYETLLGKPFVVSEHMAALGSAGDILLADFSQYLIGQKRGRGAGVQYASSIHLKFDYDQTTFRFVMRIDGQPWWPSPFTPTTGNDESPYVRLGARA